MNRVKTVTADTDWANEGVHPELGEMYFYQDDDHDEWASVMSMFFAVAEYLWHESAEEIPSEWQFRHSDMSTSEPLAVCQADEWTTETLVDTVRGFNISDDDVIAFGNWLDARSTEMRENGESY